MVTCTAGTHAGALAQYTVASEESFFLFQVEAHVIVGVPGRVHSPGDMRARTENIMHSSCALAMNHFSDFDSILIEITHLKVAPSVVNT